MNIFKTIYHVLVMLQLHGIKGLKLLRYANTDMCIWFNISQ